MGVDVATYRSRIGCCHQNSGYDVVQFTVHVNFTYTVKWLCTLPLLLFILLLFVNQKAYFDNETSNLSVLDLTKSASTFTGFHLCISRENNKTGSKCPGTVAFIGLLLIMAGIETNPGPSPNGNEKTEKDETYVAAQTHINESNLSAASNTRYNDDVEQRASHIRTKLGLSDYFPCKIILRDVIRNLTAPDIEGNNNCAWTLLRELIMVNFEARERCPYELSLQESRNIVDDKSDSSDDEDSNDENEMKQETNVNIVKNQDFFITIFTCCDLTVKQVLVSKMFLCRLAVPLIYPTFQSNQICFSLWPLRCINLDFIERKHTSLFLAKYPQKVVSFVRLSRPNYSKSLLLNAVISNQQDQHHSTFYNKNCLLGENKREITDGLVEASWYIPGEGEGNVFQEIIMFTNLRGDAADHGKQMELLTGMSNCLVITIHCRDMKNHLGFFKDIRKQAKSIILFVLGMAYRSVLKDYAQYFQGMTIVTLYEKRAEKNIATIRIEIQKNISVQLKTSNDTTLEACAIYANEHGVQVDEMSENCQQSKQDSDTLSECLNVFRSPDDKKKCLPLQETWKDISKHIKKLKRTDKSTSPSDGGDEDSALWAKEPTQKKIAELRYEQSQQALKSGSLTYKFIGFLTTNIENNEYTSYFLEWIRFHFDELSHMILPKIMDDYQKCWEKYNKEKELGKQEDVEESNEMKMQKQSLSDASFGLEHILREVGQIYESTNETKVKGITKFHQLPEIAAKLLILGYPLELMDGDAGSVPTVWVKAVLDACITLLGDKKVFIISILGVQSSGKSTFLNSLFGLQFPVSAGRCTKGLYLQMIPVDASQGLPIDYILVIDTEGLRANELALQRYDHDNELATLAVGVADMTIINIKGENTSEMRGVLEIVIHALLRLKLANDNLRFKTSCTFVHQNVSASNAKSKLKLGQQELVKLLNDVTRDAALAVGITNILSYKEVIDFDIQTDVWYFSDLWNGDPPMAHINQGYSKKVAKFKNTIMEHIQSNTSDFRSFTTIIIHILDLWKGILSEDFVFSFRNNIEVKVYNNMEVEYKKQKWALQKFQMEWIAQKHNEIGKVSVEKDFEKEFREMFEKINSNLNCFFDTNSHKEELIKWKGTQLIAFKTFSEGLRQRTKAQFSEIREQKVLQEKTRTISAADLEEITEEAKTLAKHMKGQKPSYVDLKEKFDTMWSNWQENLPAPKRADTESLENRIYDIVTRFKDKISSQIVKECEIQSWPSSVSLLFSNSESLPFKCETHFKITSFTPSRKLRENYDQILNRIWQQQFIFHCKEMTDCFQRKLFFDIRMQINQYVKHSNVRFQNGHLDQLLDMIDSSIDIHNNRGYNNFQFLPQYRAMIMVYVSRHVLHIFKDLNDRYDRQHSTEAIIGKYRSTTWNHFRNLVDEKTDEYIVATFVCEAMKAKLNETLRQHLAITIESRVRAHFSHCKFSLIVKILDNLADLEKFEMYEEYLKSPGSYALKWITEYINDRFFKTSEYTDIVCDYIERCLRESKSTIDEAGRKCKTENDKMESFIALLKNKVSIPEHIEKQMREYKLHDVENCVSEVGRMLSDLESEIKEHESKTPSIDKWATSPATNIFQGLWGCNEVCPLCGEPCQKMEEHIDNNVPHTCIQHRPEGLHGMHWITDKTLLLENCSFLVQSNNTSTCSAFRKGCRKHSDCKSDTDVLHPYRNYKTYLPDWDIEPSSDMESSKYWMWVMARFREQLVVWRKAKAPEIPASWKLISKEEAQHSLRICYGY